MVVLWELVQTAHVAGRRFADVFAEHGLSPAQYGVLASLADGEDLSQADLARAVLVRPQSMARLVSAMLEAGLVNRPGPGGRGRRAGLTLTERGRAAFEAARPAARAISLSSAIGLTDEQTSVLADLLRAVRNTLDGTVNEPSRSSAAAGTMPEDGIRR